MPVVKVWCLPEVDEPKLNALHKSIVRAVASVKELGVKDENGMTCLFPPDMMKYGLGAEIIIEVTGLFARPERTDEVRQRLAERLGQSVKELFPDTQLVECFVYPFNPSQGFWTSAAEAIDKDQPASLGPDTVGIAGCTLRRLPSGWHEITFFSEGRSALLEVRRWGSTLFHVGFRSGDAVVSEKGVVSDATYTSISGVDFDTSIGELLHKHFHFKE